MRRLKTRTRVFCTLQFEGFHRWPGAPDTIQGKDISFLRERHRHVFHVRAEKSVSHNDRDTEFIALKAQLQADVELTKRAINTGTGRLLVENWSCEMWAQHLLETFDLDLCEVSEDGENGAYIEIAD